MERKVSDDFKTLQDSGLGSFGSESDSSPIQLSKSVSETDSSLAEDSGLGNVDSKNNISNDAFGGIDVSRSSMDDSDQACSKIIGKNGQGDTDTESSAAKFAVSYFGESTLDRRYTQSMLPWVVAELRRHKSKQEIELQVINSVLLATISSEPCVVLFEHKLQTISRFGKMHQNPKSFVYLTRTDTDSPFSCHCFEASVESDVQLLFRAIKTASVEALKHHDTAQPPAPPPTLSPSEHHKHLFEVLYIGKVLVSSKKAPPTFIDEAVRKFQEYEARKEAERRRHGSGSAIKSQPSSAPQQNGGHSHQPASGVLFSMNDVPSAKPLNTGDKHESNSEEAIQALLHEQATPINDVRRTSENLHRQAVTGGQVQRNRTMLLQVGDADVSLVSPNRKTVIFERKFKDISFCSQGIQHPEYFGFISRDPTSGNFLCYVFKCATESVVEEVMQALKQAFQAAFHNISTKNHVVCELCPMHQLNKLCQEIDMCHHCVVELSVDRVHEILQSRIELLNDSDHRDLLSRLKMENPQNMEEVNECIMIILRHMCEERQREHVHLSDANKANARNELILCEASRQKLAPPSKLDHLRNRAKKSLANSFENLVRDKLNWAIAQQESIYGSTPPVSPSSNNNNNRSFQFSDSPLTPSSSSALPYRGRPRSATVPDITLSDTLKQAAEDRPEVHGQSSKVKAPEKEAAGSPIRAMFARVGKNNMTPLKDIMSPSAGDVSTPLPSHPLPTTPTATPTSSRPIRRQGSWRLDILNRVVTPARRRHINADTDDNAETRSGSQRSRELWRKAILETLLLIRMERENKSLQARQDEVESRRRKLDYEEITPCLKKVTLVWESMLHDPRSHVKVTVEQLTNAVKDGVPRSKRGDIWEFCAEYQRQTHGRREGSWPTEGASDTLTYHDLLKQLTVHQHAILIDLGRTFPSHPYFVTQLGAGQLSLFNLLKAYSLLDTEVGYCQGLSFVAGVLLMHMPEEQAYKSMKYMMFDLGLRRQYRPDMVALQIQMYQLSRLLHDHYRDLYDHLELHEIAPTLYAAPWFLTLFASQFPLGFVARVFDLIFLQGVEVIFKVALVLLGNHRELIKQCDSFETVVEFLKTTLPGMGIIQMERVINQVLQLDLSRQLQAYEVEYHVLQEEMVSNPPSSGTTSDAQISALETANQALIQHKVELLEQLQTARSHARGLESQVDKLHTEQTKLKSHIRTLELERAAMLNAISRLRKQVPSNVLQSKDLQIPVLDPNRTITNSPIHNPLVNPIVAQFMEEGKIKLATNSLTELDREVAALTASHGQRVLQANGNVGGLLQPSVPKTRPSSS